MATVDDSGLERNGGGQGVMGESVEVAHPAAE